jgi:hypothetical protein
MVALTEATPPQLAMPSLTNFSEKFIMDNVKQLFMAGIIALCAAGMTQAIAANGNQNDNPNDNGSSPVGGEPGGGEPGGSTSGGGAGGSTGGSPVGSNTISFGSGAGNIGGGSTNAMAGNAIVSGGIVLESTLTNPYPR